MHGLDPLQYFCGKDNDKILAAKLKKKYNLKRDGRASVVNSINEWDMCIAARILARKVVRKN